MTGTLRYVILVLVTFVAGFLFLRTAYFSSMENPYAQEIVLIVLGTVATILITAALLNKQSELELEKERHIKVFELKSSLYLELINFLEKIVTKGDVSEDELVFIEFLSHKISFLASEDVLREYSNFIDTLKKVMQDKQISEQDSDDISSALARLSIQIRKDLLQCEEENQELKNLIVRNAGKF